ncbi:MAG: hypothetical protein HN366_24605 [Deltaproteobacteria bacterium]|nr:hypothetical protein [Deltaproteobacteria bacterium]
MKRLSWPAEGTGLAVEVELDREGVIIQRVGIGMDREMEPALETDLPMEPETAPKKVVGQEAETVTAQARERAVVTEQIRKV